MGEDLYVHGSDDAKISYGQAISAGFNRFTEHASKLLPFAAALAAVYAVLTLIQGEVQQALLPDADEIVKNLFSGEVSQGTKSNLTLVNLVGAVVLGITTMLGVIGAGVLGPVARAGCPRRRGGRLQLVG